MDINFKEATPGQILDAYKSGNVEFDKWVKHFGWVHNLSLKNGSDTLLPRKKFDNERSVYFNKKSNRGSLNE